MPSRDYRTDRRASNRGPVILPFDRLERRQLLTAADVSSIQQTITGLLGADSTGTASPSTAAASTGDTAIATSTTSTPTANTTVTVAAVPMAATTTAADPTATVTTTTQVSATPAQTVATTTATPTTGTSGSYTVLPGNDVTAVGRLTPVSLSAPSSLAWGQTFVLTGSIRNNSSVATTTPAEANIYLSPTANTGTNSESIATFTVPAGLPPGALFNFKYPLTIPKSPNQALLAGSSYYITTTVGFASATNTGSGAQGVDASKVNVAQALPAHLIAAGISVAPGTSDWGQDLNITAKVTNSGPGDAPATNARIILVPYGQDPFGPTGYTIGSVPIPQIAAGQTVSGAQAIRLPYSPPAVLANVSKFTLVMVSDATGLANPVVTPSTYQGLGLDWTTVNLTARPTDVPVTQLPQVTATALTTPTVISWGQNIDLKVHVQNVGSGDAGPFDVRFSLIQNNVAGAPVLLLGDAHVSSLKAGQSQDVVQTIKLPSQAPAGMVASGTAGRIIATIDPNHTLNEVRSSASDTIQSPPITLKLVAQDGTTTPVVTSTTHSTAPTPVTTKTTTTAPPGAGSATVAIPITTQPTKTKIVHKVVRHKPQPVVHRTVTHLKVYPAKHQAITVNTQHKQIRLVAAKLAQSASSRPNLPA